MNLKFTYEEKTETLDHHVTCKIRTTAYSQGLQVLIDGEPVFSIWDNGDVNLYQSDFPSDFHVYIS